MRWTIASRLAALAAAGVLGLALTTYLGLCAARTATARLAVVAQDTKLLRNQLGVETLSERLRGDVVHAVLNSGQASSLQTRSKVLGHVQSLTALASSNRRLVEEAGVSPALQEQILAVEEAIEPFVADCSRIMDVVVDSPQDPLVLLSELEGTYSHLGEAVESCTASILGHNERGMDAAQASMGRGERRALIFGVLAMLTLSCLVCKTRRSLLKSIHSVMDSIQAIGTLDFTSEAQLEGLYELEEIDRALAVAAGAVREVLFTMEAASTVLSDSADDLNGVSNRLIQEATNTAEHATAASGEASRVDGSMQTVSTCVSQMEGTVREIAKTSEEAARVAGTAVESAATARETINELQESSQEVTGIVRVINEIAEQTNLLALNATIEAARAGELGKGFAVVAGEVKELAKQTAEATNDISRRVQASQDSAKKATISIEEVASVIQEIHKMQSMTSSAIYEQATVTSEIGRSIGVAAGESASIAARMQSVSGLADSAHSDLKTITTCAGSVSSTSRDLRETLKRFRF